MPLPKGNVINPNGCIAFCWVANLVRFGLCESIMTNDITHDFVKFSYVAYGGVMSGIVSHCGLLASL